jgi:hypothetical protein
MIHPCARGACPWPQPVPPPDHWQVWGPSSSSSVCSMALAWYLVVAAWAVVLAGCLGVALLLWAAGSPSQAPGVGGVHGANGGMPLGGHCKRAATLASSRPAAKSAARGVLVDCRWGVERGGQSFGRLQCSLWVWDPLLGNPLAHDD